MEALEAITKIGGFNQGFLMQHYNKCSPYSGPHRHKDDAIYNFFSSVPAHNGTTSIELILVTKTLLTNVYMIESNSSLNISNILQDRYHERGIPINI